MDNIGKYFRCITVARAIIFVVIFGALELAAQKPSGDIVAEARPSASVSSLETFLAKFKIIVEKHDWQALIALCDKDHFTTQMVGMEEGDSVYPIQSYIAEILGLHMVGNSIGTGKQVMMAELNKIVTIKFEKESIVAWGQNGYIKGSVILKDGSKLGVTLYIDKNKLKDDCSPVYVLSGAVG